MSERLPESEWKWRGMPGHFICADDCCFHIVTDIRQYRVSTIGCYHDPEHRKNKSYENRATIGAGRLYETFVFAIGADDSIVPSELESEGYNDERDAERGHLMMCRKVAGWSPLPERSDRPPFPSPGTDKERDDG